MVCLGGIWSQDQGSMIQEKCRVDCNSRCAADCDTSNKSGNPWMDRDTISQALDFLAYFLNYHEKEHVITRLFDVVLPSHNRQQVVLLRETPPCVGMPQSS